MENKDENEPTLADVTAEEWISNQSFRSTRDVEIPDKMSDRVIGQDRAVEVMKKAASQKRHMMLIGEPGTGKSMLANSMVEYLPKDEMQDIVAYSNPEDENEPRVRTFPAGRGKQVVQQQKAQAAMSKNQKNTSYMYACAAIVILGFIGSFVFNNFYVLCIALFAVMIILIFARNPVGVRNDTAYVPKLLVGHDASDMPPFVDATGTHSGALLGDVRHDPYGGHDKIGVPAYQRVIPGAIHEAHEGVLFVDEISHLGSLQRYILTAMQDKKFPITGRNPQSSGASVKVENVPCDFILVAACNMQDLENILSPLRSRIIGNGYEVLVDVAMPDNSHNRAKYAQFVAQEIAMDGHVPPAAIDAVEEIISEGKRRAKLDGQMNALTLRLRELGGLIRAAGDIAVMEKAKYITADHVKRAKKRSEPVEEQIKQRYGSYQKGMTHDISDAQKQKSEYYLQNEHIDDSMYQ